MQVRTLFAALALAAGLSITPAHGQTITPCEVYMCMAGLSGAGATGGPACAPALAYWHTVLVVYDSSGFDAPATALRRRTYLMTCPGAQVATNAAVLNAIITEWGSVP